MITHVGTANEQTLSVVKVLLYVGPVAVYILWLGLLNSQATPKLIKARDDFLVMTVAFLPFVVAPVVSLACAGYEWAGVSAAGLMLLLFLRLLPPNNSGWVIYNLSPRRGRMLADRALRSLGRSYRWDGWMAHVAEIGLSVEISSVPVLRNVTFRVHPSGAKPSTSDVAVLRRELARRLSAEAGLPSVTGCCLLMGGVGLLILPLWMMSQHSAAIAEVMTRILLS